MPGEKNHPSLPGNLGVRTGPNAQLDNLELQKIRSMIVQLQQQVGGLPTSALPAGTVIVPVGGCITAPLSASNIATLFDATGLGVPGKAWAGWAIRNGNNGTTNLTGKFLRFNTAAAGATGGADSQASNVTGAVLSGVPGIGTLAAPAHTHTSAAHTHSLSADGWADIACVTALYQRMLTTSGWNATNKSTLTSSADTTWITNGAQLAGATDSKTPGDTGGASATDLTGALAIGTLAVSALVNNAVENRPAFFEDVPLQRVA